jgi:flagellar basal-body rod protein FlgG
MPPATAPPAATVTNPGRSHAMNHALDTIATGLEASQTMMDTIADNLSNVNTTGFKSETPEFQSLVYQDSIQPGANSSGQTIYPSGLELGTGVKVASIKDTLTQGTLATTGNPLDLAINGSGYFQILQPNGQTAYTRDGAFQLNQNGQLVNSSGYQVLPNVTIPSNATSVTIGTDGTVSVTVPGSSSATQVGQIQLANFINPQGLQPLGGNLFASTTASGSAIAGAPQSNGLGSVNQNYLESSNVDVVQAMVNMISAERAYQLSTQAASAVDNQLNYLAQAAAGA